MTIYDLKLHEAKRIGGGIDIMRVPGGWLYLFFTKERGLNKIDHSTFVPYHVEFKQVPGLTINKTP